MGGRRPGLEGHLLQTHRVRGIARADDDHDVDPRCDRLDRALTVLGGVADVVAGRVGQVREALAQQPHRLQGLVHAQRRLADPHDLLRVAHLDPVHLVGPVDHLDALGGLALGALDLLVAGVTDQDDVVVVLGEADRLLVDLGHQRAGRVDRGEVTGGRLLVHGRGDAVGGEDHARALGHLVGLGDENRPAPGQRLHDVLVVDDLLAHVDGGAVVRQGLLDGVDGAVHPGAVAAGSRQQDPLDALARRSGVGHRVGAGRRADLGRRPAVLGRRSAGGRRRAGGRRADLGRGGRLGAVVAGRPDGGRRRRRLHALDAHAAHCATAALRLPGAGMAQWCM